MRGGRPARSADTTNGGVGIGDDRDSLQIRLVTFNVRYATDTPVADEQPWAVRCPKLSAQLRFVTSSHQSSFLCFQELLYSQVLDIQASLGPEWAYIGRGRDDGKQAGEFSPVFYRIMEWRCIRTRMYWLSETPTEPSRGWDAALNRVVTVGLFHHRSTGAPVVVMSTHFDHLGVQARRESANLILTIAEDWERRQDGCDGYVAGGHGWWGQPKVPVFLGGDFNSDPGDGAYKVITEDPGALTDLVGLLPPEKRYGNTDITYTSFGEPNEIPKRIDFLFVRDTENVQVSTFGILSNRFDDGVYLSDHRAVVSDVQINLSKD